jgi:WhiB family redox-sensing transcriptional regulator
VFADQLQDITDERQDWTLAACRQPGIGDLFFSEQIPDINRAKAICATCPLLEPCLRGAVLRAEPWGVWGGQLFLNGRILAQKRKRGRPPKVRPPEPEVVLPASIALLIAELDGTEAQSA